MITNTEEKAEPTMPSVSEEESDSSSEEEIKPPTGWPEPEPKTDVKEEPRSDNLIDNLEIAPFMPDDWYWRHRPLSSNNVKRGQKYWVDQATLAYPLKLCFERGLDCSSTCCK